MVSSCQYSVIQASNNTTVRNTIFNMNVTLNVVGCRLIYISVFDDVNASFDNVTVFG